MKRINKSIIEQSQNLDAKQLNLFGFPEPEKNTVTEHRKNTIKEIVKDTINFIPSQKFIHDKKTFQHPIGLINNENNNIKTNYRKLPKPEIGKLKEWYEKYNPLYLMKLHPIPPDIEILMNEKFKNETEFNFI